MSIPLQTISTRVPEETKESIAVEALDGAKQHKPRQLPLSLLAVGEVVQGAQAQVLEVPVGESRDQPLGGIAKARQVEAMGRVDGMMDPATRGATTVTPGATTSTKTTDLIPGLMRPISSRAGVPMVEKEVRAGALVEMAPEQGLATIGGSPKKVLTQWAGTATVIDLAPDVGASQVEPIPAAVTPG